ncbi:hypothetical protein BpHYR1_045154 [Brachionus plicatilis]|uniref:Uncharacterized protein n=1 Tax=Brachionus plicatilis TaxID=10195 RepID=A0A3M7SJS4_BRAPC|nr:hypothetical protein BpHYR1_045154 [Brachionus plicatilis]
MVLCFAWNECISGFKQTHGLATDFDFNGKDLLLKKFNQSALSRYSSSKYNLEKALYRILTIIKNTHRTDTNIEILRLLFHLVKIILLLLTSLSVSTGIPQESKYQTVPYSRPNKLNYFPKNNNLFFKRNNPISYHYVSHLSMIAQMIRMRQKLFSKPKIKSRDFLNLIQMKKSSPKKNQRNH